MMRIVWKLKAGNTAVVEGTAQSMAWEKSAPPVRIRHFESLKLILMVIAKKEHLEAYSFSQYDYQDLPEKALEQFLIHKPAGIVLEKPSKKKAI